LEVQTGYIAQTPPQAITGITNDNPAVVTATGSNYELGTVVKAANIVGMTELNDQLLVPSAPAVNDFEAAGVDATGYGTYASGGTLREVEFGNFCELTGANQQDGAADQVEVSTICSTAKEFEQGLSDTGTLQLDFNYAPLEAVQAAVDAAKTSGDAIVVRIKFPKSGGIVILIGTVQQASFQGQVNGVWTGSATLKLTGPKFVMAGGV
jgi:hypothetical protein